MLAGIIIGLVVWPVASFAQDAPVEDEPASPIKPGLFHFSLQRVRLEFEGDYEWRKVRDRPSRQRKLFQKNVDFRLRESISLRFEGDVIDPNLIEWTADLTFGLRQSRFREEINHFDRTDSDTGYLLEFDISLEALKTKPISVSAYARRFDDRIPRRFLPSLRERQTEAGVSVLAITGPVTTEIGFDWRDVDRTGNSLDEDDESFESLRFHIDSEWDISDTQTLKLAFEHEEQESTFQGSRFDFDTRRDEFRLEYELRFGPDGKHRLDTYLRLNEERGDLNRDEFEISSRLSLEHSERFRTVYRYNFYSFEQDNIEVDQHKLDVQALFQPAENLRISLDAFGLFEQVERDVETHQFGAGLDLAYQRPTDSGELSLNVSLAFDREQTRGDAGRRVLRDEAHPLSDVRPVFLRQQNVLLTTVLAHNLTRSRYFVQGIDYRLVLTSNRVGIRRIPTGRIAEDDVVYFDYQYIIPTRSTINTFRTDLLVEHRFDFGLTPYYNFEGRFQNVDFDSAGRPFDRDNMDRHRMGLRFERPHWSVGAEYEIFDDSIEPYDAFHLTSRWSVLHEPRHSLDIAAELSRYQFEGGFDDRRVWWLNLDVSDRWQLGPYLSMNTSVGYRWEDDSLDGMTDGVDVEWALSYERNYLAVELAVEYDLLSFDDSREDGYGIFLRITRDLSHILDSR